MQEHKFQIRPVLKSLRVGEIADFPCGRNTETHMFGDRRESIRSTAAALKKHEGLRFSVRVESDRTRVTRLEDDPNFTGSRSQPHDSHNNHDSIRGRIVAMSPGDEILFSKDKAPYLRSLTSLLRRTEHRHYSVNAQRGGAYVFVECISVPRPKTAKQDTLF